VPAALSGIAAGNSPKMTWNYFESIQTLTASIAQTVQGESRPGRCATTPCSPSG
jgi:ABC-type uncharacterized transport system permease subunit